eukprot:scaffold39829_cov36-Prasinocladus_malaysianus.AAC.1
MYTGLRAHLTARWARAGFAALRGVPFTKAADLAAVRERAIVNFEALESKGKRERSVTNMQDKQIVLWVPPRDRRRSRRIIEGDFARLDIVISDK